MKNKFIVILTVIFTFVTCVGIDSLFENVVRVNDITYNNLYNIVIDAGHGGIDAGTVGTDGANEKDINLQIALKLYDFLMVCGVDAVLIRNDDELFYDENDDTSRSDLYNRLDFVNSIHNSILVSIHQNHFADSKEWGMQVWYSPNDDTSKILADNILNITKQALQPNNERVNKESDSSYYILYNASVPSVMVECGFMSNEEENAKLQDNNYQACLAYTISLGVGEYISEEL